MRRLIRLFAQMWCFSWRRRKSTGRLCFPSRSFLGARGKKEHGNMKTPMFHLHHGHGVETVSFLRHLKKKRDGIGEPERNHHRKEKKKDDFPSLSLLSPKFPAANQWVACLFETDRAWSHSREGFVQP